MIVEIIGAIMVLGAIGIWIKACGVTWKETFIAIFTIIIFISGLALLLGG